MLLVGLKKQGKERRNATLHGAAPPDAPLPQTANTRREVAHYTNWARPSQGRPKQWAWEREIARQRYRAPAPAGRRRGSPPCRTAQRGTRREREGEREAREHKFSMRETHKGHGQA